MQSGHDEPSPDDRLQRPRVSPDARILKSSGSAHRLTPQMIATLEGMAESAQKWSTGAALVTVIVAVVLVILGLTFTQGCDPAFFLLSAAWIALLVKVVSWRKGASLRADIEGGVYLTVSGPISYHIAQVEAGQDGGDTYFFRVDGEDFPVTSRTWEEIRSTTWGAVDYAPRSRIVFALRDRSGAVVYAG
jgi:hypothetical protein